MACLSLPHQFLRCFFYHRAGKEKDFGGVDQKKNLSGIMKKNNVTLRHSSIGKEEMGWKGKGGIEHARKRGSREREHGNDEHVTGLHKQLLRLSYPLCCLKGAEQHWFDGYERMPDVARICLDGGVGGKEVTTTTAEYNLETWETIAKTVFSKEVEAWNVRQAKRATGEDKWLAGIEQKGTLNDRISAMALRCQQSPIHRLSSLFGLLDMAEKHERRSCQAAIEALKDLFINNLLPDGRLLVPLTLRPITRVVELPIQVAGQALVLWRYEDHLRLAVRRVLNVLQRLSSDTVAVVKRSAIDTVLELLSAKPEGEGFLLSIMVNKLGEPDRSASSQAHRSLLTLLKRHPAMKGVVIREVHQFLHRQNLPIKGLYAGISVLSHIFLIRGEDADIATEMVRIYFELFERALNAGNLKTRLLGAILTGVKRAMPYMGSEDSRMKTLHGYTDHLFRLVHDGGFTTATQSMGLLWQMVVLLKKEDSEGKSTDSSSQLTSRFYSALYAKLLSADFWTGSHLTEFLNLVFQSIKYDTDRGRICAICKRLLQVASFSSPSLCSAALLIVSEALGKHQYLRKPLLTEGGGGKEGSSSIPTYNPTKRNPSHACGGIMDCEKGDHQLTQSSSLPPLWEASLLQFHYHPSVAKFAQSLLTPPGHGITYHGDPLQDMSLSMFLDKMAFRSPKKLVLAARKGEDRRAAGWKSLQDSGNVETFASVPLEMVRSDEVFLHRYFREREVRDDAGLNRRRRKKGLKMNQDNNDDKLGSVIAENVEDEEEIDAFANKLADGLSRSTGDNLEDEEDLGDIGDWDGPEGTDTEDEGSDSDSYGDKVVKGESSSYTTHTADNSSTQSGSGDELDSNEDGEAGGDADDFMDDDSNTSDGEEEQQPHGKKKGINTRSKVHRQPAKKFKRKSESDFAAAEDYVDVLNQFNPDGFDGSISEGGGGDLPSHNLKGMKKRRR